MCVASCSSIPRRIKNAFTYCHVDAYTGLDTLININGFYTLGTIFYDNGLAVDLINDDAVNLQRKDSLYLKELVEKRKYKKGKYSYYNFIDCGGYTICGDTIKVKMIHKGYSINDFWIGRETWYKIIDKNTLLVLGDFLITTNEKDKEYERKAYPFSGGSTVEFKPVSFKPPLDYYWILKEKWFWCNESDWKTYMGNIKHNK